MGATLEASESGVVVKEIAEGSSAAAELKVNDLIVSVMDKDASGCSFDEVMAMLTSAPDTVQLEVTRTTITRKLRSADDGNAQGSQEQEPSKLDKAFAKNFGSAEATKKILTKTAKITANPTTWKNPIYFWSIAGTALLFVPIIWYSVTN